MDPSYKILIKPARNDAPLLALREKVIALNRLEKNGTKTFVFNTTNPIETMFYTDLIAHERLPDEQEIKVMASLNYHILYWNPRNYPILYGQIKD